MTAPLETRIAAFTAALTQAREITLAGGFVDLTGLDGAAEAICVEIKSLPGPERKAAAAHLATMAAGLDALAATLAAAPGAGGEGPGSRHARAGRAYGISGQQGHR